LSAIFDKFIFIAPEVKHDLQLEQSEFQSMVSGESVQVNIKFQKARSVEWNVPGILAGNEVPSWRDNAGSILRRIVVFDFKKSVKKADTTLGNKLAKELPQIIVKCNLAYLDAVSKYGEISLWECLPKYFHDKRRDLAEVTHPLMSFLSSDQIVYGEDLCLPMFDFKLRYQDYCKSNSLSMGQIPNDDYYTGPFSENNLKIVMQNGTKYVEGMTFVELNDDIYSQMC
jgi:phage/plasmid-associated DNA primase